MSERQAGIWIKALRRLVRQVGLYPTGHPLTMEALMALRSATDDLVPEGGQVVVSATDNAFFHNRTILPHVSLEYHSFIRELEERGRDAALRAVAADLAAGHEEDAVAAVLRLAVLRRQAHPGRIDQTDMAPDHAGLLQVADPPKTGRRRQTDVARQIGIADTRVLLKFLQNSSIDVVQV